MDFEVDFNSIDQILEEQKQKEEETLKNKEYLKLKSRVLSIDKVLNTVRIWKEHATNVKIELESERKQHKEAIVNYMNLDQAHKDSLIRIKQLESEIKNTVVLEEVINQQAESLLALQKNITSLMSDNNTYKQDHLKNIKEISRVKNFERRRYNCVIKKLIMYGDLAKEAGLLNDSQLLSLEKFKKQIVQKNASDVDKILDNFDAENEFNTYESSDTGRGSSLETFEDDKYSISSSYYENCPFKDISSPIRIDINSLNSIFSPERPAIENHNLSHSKELLTDFEKDISYDKSTIPIRSILGSDMICSPIEAVENVEKTPDSKEDGKTIIDRCTSPFRNGVHSVETSTSPINVCDNYNLIQSPTMAINDFHKTMYDRSTSPIRNIITNTDVASSPIKIENNSNYSQHTHIENVSVENERLSTFSHKVDTACSPIKSNIESKENNTNTRSRSDRELINRGTSPIATSKQYIDAVCSPMRVEEEYTFGRISPLENIQIVNIARDSIKHSPMRLEEEYSNDRMSPLINIQIPNTTCNPILHSPIRLEENSNGPITLLKNHIENTECNLKIHSPMRIEDKHSNGCISPLKNIKTKKTEWKAINHPDENDILMQDDKIIDKEIALILEDACRIPKLLSPIPHDHLKFSNSKHFRRFVTRRKRGPVHGVTGLNHQSQMRKYTNACLKKLTSNVASLNRKFINFSNKASQMDIIMPQILKLLQATNSNKKLSYVAHNTTREYHQNNLNDQSPSDLNREKSLPKYSSTEKHNVDSNVIRHSTKNSKKKINMIDLFGDDNSVNNSAPFCEAAPTAKAPNDHKVGIEKISFGLKTTKLVSSDDIPKIPFNQKHNKNKILESQTAKNIQQLSNEERTESSLRQSHRLATVSPKIEKQSSHPAVDANIGEHLPSQSNQDISNYEIVPKYKIVSLENTLHSKSVVQKILSPSLSLVQSDVNSSHKMNEPSNNKTSDLDEESVTPIISMQNVKIETEKIKFMTRVDGRSEKYRRRSLSNISTRTKSGVQNVIIPLTEQTERCTQSNLSKRPTSDLENVIVPLSEPTERLNPSKILTRTTSESHNVVSPLSEPSGRSPSFNISTRSKSDFRNVVAPLYESFGRSPSSNNTSRTLDSQNVIAPLSKPTTENISINVSSIFVDILRDHAGDIFTTGKVQKNRKVSDENKKKILDTLEDNLGAQPNMMLESFQLKKVCDILSDEKPKHVAWAMIEFMMSDNRKSDVLCKKYTPPAPPMLKSEQRLVLCVRELVARADFSPKTSFLDTLQSGIEYILFRLTKECSPKIVQVERLAHFYAVLCRLYNQPLKLRYFIVDALYSLSYTALGLVIQVMEVWSHVFPMADTKAAKNPLVLVIVHLLHFFKRNNNMKYKVQDHSEKIRFLLFKKYKYDMGEFGQSQLLTFLKKSIESNHGDTKHNQDDITLAFILVAKRYGVMWCHKHIEQDILMPAICDRSVSPYMRLMAVKLIGPLLRPYSVHMKPHCEAAVVKLSSILHDADSREIEEAAIGSLFYLRRQCFVQLVDIFRSWKPKYEPSDLIKKQLRLFVGGKPIAVWNKILMS